MVGGEHDIPQSSVTGPIHLDIGFFPNEIKTRFFFGRVPSHPFRKFIFPTAISQIPSASVWLDRMEDPSGRKRKKGNSLLLICVLTRSFCWRSTIPRGHTRPNVLPPIHSFTEDVTAGNKTHTHVRVYSVCVLLRVGRRTWVSSVEEWPDGCSKHSADDQIWSRFCVTCVCVCCLMESWRLWERSTHLYVSAARHGDVTRAFSSAVGHIQWHRFFFLVLYFSGSVLLPSFFLST